LCSAWTRRHRCRPWTAPNRSSRSLQSMFVYSI
jgi:hypothetical protein